MPVTNTDFQMCTGTLQMEKILMCLTEATELRLTNHTERILHISYVTCGKITYNSTEVFHCVIKPTATNVFPSFYLGSSNRFGLTEETEKKRKTEFL